MDPESRYRTWTVIELRNEMRSRGIECSQKRKAELIHSLVQDDEEAENEVAEDDEADAAPSDQQGQAIAAQATGDASAEVMEDGGAQSTDNQSVSPAGDGSREVGEPGKLTTIRPVTAHPNEAEGKGCSTNKGSQVMPDAPQLEVLSEVSGNEPVVPEVTDA